jgi:hypothetical protein
MKLFLSALCASFIIAPLSFAAPAAELKQEVLAGACGKCDCDKCKNGKCSDCDKCKKSEVLLTDCGKCKKKECDKDKEKKEGEGTLAGDKCKKDGDCDKEKKEEGTLAHCGKCAKDKEKKEEEKKEDNLA